MTSVLNRINFRPRPMVHYGRTYWPEVFTKVRIRHRFWSGDPSMARTKYVHIAKPCGVAEWRNRSACDRTLVFHRVLVDTYCATSHLSHPVDLETSTLVLCPKCIANCPEENL